MRNVWDEGDDPGVGFQGRSTEGETVALLLNYNQWGRKCVPNPDMFLAATAAESLGVPAVLAPFLSEGGAIEVDGGDFPLEPKVGLPSLVQASSNKKRVEKPGETRSL